MALMQGGLNRGYSPPKITMRDVPKQVADLIPSDPLQSARLAPFKEFPPSICGSRPGQTRRTRQAGLHQLGRAGLSEIARVSCIHLRSSVPG